MNTQDFTRFHSRLRLLGTLRLETSLRIGAGRSDSLEGGADINVVKDASGAPYIPGSSFKGVLRSHVEALLRTINEGYACLCVTEREHEDTGCPTTRDSKRLREQIEELQKKIQQKKAPPDAVERFYLDESCWACQVFGSPWLASKVMIRDLTVAGDWLGRYQHRDGVAIDRDTETASEHKLYSFEAVPAGTEFECEIILENATTEEQGMVLLGLKAFELGQVLLGGARSRGLGRVALTWNWEQCYEVDEADKVGLLDYLLTGQGRSLGNEQVRKETIDGKITALRRSLGV
jgi:CRISPR-associated RAMP protein (TIGR02581 family)